MKLFDLEQPQIEKTAKSTSDVERHKIQKVVVISSRQEVRQKVCNQLRMHNINQISEQDTDFFSLTDNRFVQQADTAVIDICHCTDIPLINQTLMLCIPTQVHYLLVGDNDSITFAQQLAHNGAGYSHLDSQLEQLVNQLRVNSGHNRVNHSLKISVLGCKGGVGTSTIAWQLFNLIGQLTVVPLLLVQGASGSRDLGLLADTTSLPADGSFHSLNQHQTIRLEPFEECWSYNDPHFNRFNLILFDHSLHTQPHERYEELVARSDTLILVFSRELAAVRLVKVMLEENRRFMLTQQGQEKRLLLYLNENHPARGNELKNSDIEEYLATPLNMVQGYQNAGYKLSAPGSPLHRFAAELLGKPANNKGAKNGIRNFFSRMFAL